MKTTYRNSRVFHKNFRTYFVLLLVLLAIGFGIYLLVLRQERTNAVQRGYEADAERMAAALDTQNARLKSVKNSLLQTMWVRKLITPADTFDEEFSLFRLADYQQDLQRYILLDDSILDVVLFLPEKDLAAAQSGWYTMTEYEFYLHNRRNISMDSLVPLLGVYHSSDAFQELAYNLEDHPYFLLLESLEQIRKPRATLMLVLNRSRYEESLRAVAGENVTGIRLVGRQDRVLFSVQTAEPDPQGQTITVPSRVFGIQYQFDYLSPAHALHGQQWVDAFFWLCAVFCILAACGAAFLLSSWNYRPLRRVMDHLSDMRISGLPGDGNATEYDIIRNSLENLYDENQLMKQTVQQYYLAARNDMLTQLLKGHFYGDELRDKLNSFGLPYTDERYYAVMLVQAVEEPEEESLSLPLDGSELLVPLRKALARLRQSFEIVNALDNDIVIILCFDAPPEGDAVPAPVREAVRQCASRSQKPRGVLEGKMYPGLLGISKSYQFLKERLENPFRMDGLLQLEQGDSFYYPTDWEIQLIQQLKEGNLPVVVKILRELQTENESRSLTPQIQSQLLTLLTETVMRVVYELQIGTEELDEQARGVLRPEGGAPAMWERLFQLIAEVCKRNVRLLSEQSLTKTGVREMIAYVNQNFHDPMISLKDLGSRFDLSVQAVSRTFKAATSVNFYDYLTQLRMEKSKELLRTLGYVPTEIAHRVGYENEYSFKRAFLRYEHCKPREYYNRITNES